LISRFNGYIAVRRNGLDHNFGVLHRVYHILAKFQIPRKPFQTLNGSTLCSTLSSTTLFPIVVTHGGIQTDDFDDADYIFSSNAAAKDTLRY